MAAQGPSAIAANLNASEPKGPTFLDTGGCRCALQEQLEKDAWRCVANITGDVYTGQTGQWFYAGNQTDPDSLKDPTNSDSNPPDTDTAYEIQNNQFQPYIATPAASSSFLAAPTRAPDDSLEDDGTADSSLFARASPSTIRDTPSAADPSSALTAANNATGATNDDICTGKNNTLASTQFYQKAGAVKNGSVPCWQIGTEPIVIQTAANWTADGCNKGFLCLNNSAQNPPQYCPPYPAAQELRLAGGTVQPPQGRYEPIVCLQGNYCPPGGAQNLTCPSGHYCSIGAYEPTKCSAGSHCPPGTIRDRSMLPLAVLILLDVVLISLTIAAKIIHGQQKKNHKATAGPKMLTKALTSIGRPGGNNNHYHSISEDIHLESRLPGPRRAPTGFLAAMDNEYAFDESDIENDEKTDPDIQQFVQSLSRCTVAAEFGLSFEFEDLKFQPKKSPKPILSQVTGEIRGGSFWGVMGASGAGKSTFVNVLMGRQSHTGGVTKVNGSPGVISKYKKIIGYVPQDDIVLPELTVRENILHSARIRLPSNWKESEIQNHVDILLNCLQLSHVKDSLVGSTAAPVISGGQRKRVSIGMELAAAPMALFLDEPTSGLDATSASSIMMTLKALSRLGITIVTIIHQPRHEIFDALDDLLLFGAGRMIYSGKEADVQNYFEQCGFEFPKNGNPADIIMDIIAGKGQLYKKAGNTDVQHLIEYWKDRQDSLKGSPPTTSPPSSAEITALKRTVKMRGAPWYIQIYLCFSRALLQQYRLKSSFYYELGVAGLAGGLIGLAEMGANGIQFRGIFQPPYELLSSSVDFQSVPQMSLLVGLAIGLTASSPGVKIFGEEKLIYLREASAGHNRFAYYLGKVMSTIPRMILANFHFTVIFYVLATPKISWGAAFIANLMYFYCIYGLASCISMITRREDGPLIATMASLIVGILSGVSPRLATVKGWHLLWLWQASPGTWFSEGYFTENVTPYEYLYQINMAADKLGFTLYRFSLDLLVLFAIGCTYRVLAFLLLRVFNRKANRS